MAQTIKITIQETSGGVLANWPPAAQIESYPLDIEIVRPSQYQNHDLYITLSDCHVSKRISLGLQNIYTLNEPFTTDKMMFVQPTFIAPPGDNRQTSTAKTALWLEPMPENINPKTPDTLGLLAKNAWAGELETDENGNTVIRNIKGEIIGEVSSIGGSGTGGTNDYNALTHKPAIDGAELEENSTAAGLGLATQTDLQSEASARGNADAVLQSNIDAEASARQTAEAALQGAVDTAAGNLNSHLSNTANPHEVSLQQSADKQSTTGTVLPSGTEGIFEGSNTAPNKLLTRAEVQAETQNALRYKGQMKFGVEYQSSMSIIPLADPGDGTPWAQEGDQCGCQETQTTWELASGSWTELPHSVDADGDMYDILYFYGNWSGNGQSYNGEVSAQIKCVDGASNKFDLVVLANTLLDGSVTDAKIGNRALADEEGSSELITAGEEKSITSLFQGMRNNLKWLFNGTMKRYEVEKFGQTVYLNEARIGQPLTPERVQEWVDENINNRCSNEGLQLIQSNMPTKPCIMRSFTDCSP